MTNPYRAMCAELLAWAEHTSSHYYKQPDVLNRARALLAQPEPQSLPANYIDPEHTGQDWEVLEIFYTACQSEGGTADEIHLRGIRAVLAARAVLSHWGCPTPQPVAVSERLPGPEDCDEQGRCWVGGGQLVSGSPTWILGYSAWASRFPDVHYCWLPANALPTPETNV